MNPEILKLANQRDRLHAESAWLKERANDARDQAIELEHQIQVLEHTERDPQWSVRNIIPAPLSPTLTAEPTPKVRHDLVPDGRTGPWKRDAHLRTETQRNVFVLSYDARCRACEPDAVTGRGE